MCTRPHHRSLPNWIEDEGIAVPEHIKYSSYWATYDIEAMQINQTNLNSTEKLEWTHKHVPASVSLCSNVPDHTEPICFISKGDPKELVVQMVEHFQTISVAAEAIFREDEDIIKLFETIEMKIKMDEARETGEEDDQDPETGEEEKDCDIPPPKKHLHRLRKLLPKLESHFSHAHPVTRV